MHRAEVPAPTLSKYSLNWNDFRSFFLILFSIKMEIGGYNSNHVWPKTGGVKHLSSFWRCFRGSTIGAVCSFEASELGMFCTVGPWLPKSPCPLSRQLFKCQEMFCSLKTPCRKWLSFEWVSTDLNAGGFGPEHTPLYFSSHCQQLGGPSGPAVSGSERQVWIHHHWLGTRDCLPGPFCSWSAKGKVSMETAGQSV